MSLLSSSFQNRHYGLDVVRASSLIIILIVHCMIFVGKYYKLSAFVYFGVLAVELFFALSGFLIGTIILKIIQQEFSFKTLVTFWLKRWMRTLPAYFVVIAFIMFFHEKIFFSFFFFLQNYVPDELHIFPVSWTISLEEWFYLTFPILLFTLYKLFHTKLSPKRIFLLTTLIYIIVPLFLRAWTLSHFSDSHWDLYLRKRIFIRFDTIGYGLLLAWINYYYKPFLYKKSIKNLSLVLSAVLMLMTWWLYNSSVDIFNGGLNWSNTLGVFPGVNLVCAFAIVYALSFETPKNKSFATIMTTISILSYSLYLVHYQFFRFFAKKSSNETEAWLYMTLAIFITFSVGFILNITVEKYFINKRNSWIKS